MSHICLVEDNLQIDVFSKHVLQICLIGDDLQMSYQKIPCGSLEGNVLKMYIYTYIYFYVRYIKLNLEISSRDVFWLINSFSCVFSV